MKSIFAYFCVILLFATLSCRSAKEAKALKDCSYSFSSISDLKVGTISMQGKQSFKDLGSAETIGISQLLMTKQLPISLTANIAITNPNKKTAGIESLEWILIVHEKEVATGNITEKIEIKPNEKIILPIPIQTDLSTILKSFSLKEISQLMFNLSDVKGIPLDAKIKIKPSISIGKKQIKTPAYFTIPVPTQ